MSGGWGTLVGLVVVGLLAGSALAWGVTEVARRRVELQTRKQADVRSKYLALEIRRLARSLAVHGTEESWPRGGDEEALMSQVLEYSMIERDLGRGHAVVTELAEAKLGRDVKEVVREASTVIEERVHDEELVTAQPPG
jgi:hypothetical protein